MLGVDALGFGNEQPTALQLYLQLELTIRLAQQVTLGDQFRRVCPSGREVRLQSRNVIAKLGFAVDGFPVADHALFS